MQRYARETVEQVLAANDIVDVIGARVELKPAGTGRLKGLCPFHNEKTPSFFVNRHRQSFYCFGCEKGGDALSFLQEHDGMPFVDGLRYLADRGSVSLPALSEKESREEGLREELFAFGKFAARFYQQTLADPGQGRGGRAYLDKRQLKDETLSRFGVGFVPEGWSNLMDAARKKGFKDRVLEASGMFKRGERGSFYDFFRNRVTFPIRDLTEHVVAFGGRTVGDEPAKYINSPETPIYRKSRILYGLYEARDALRHAQYAILVEGYFDVLRCFDAGIENVVASCGTALTPDQAKLIRRYVPEAVVLYDGDAAGIRAAIRGIGVLAAAGLTVRATALPDGQDPDDYIRAHGPEEFGRFMEKADDFVTFYVRMSAERCRTIEGRTEVAHEVFEILRSVEDDLRIDEYVKRLAEELGLNPYLCRREYDTYLREKIRRPARSKTEEAPVQPSIALDDRDFVAALLADPARVEQVRGALDGQTYGSGPVIEIIEELTTAPSGNPGQGLASDEARRLYFAAANAETPDPERAEELVAKRTNGLRRQALCAEAERVQRELQEAERASDSTRIAELFALRLQLARQIEGVGGT